MAVDTLALCGLDKGPSEITDANGQIVAIDRYAQRMEAWATAKESKSNLDETPTQRMRQQVVMTAQATGFFSIWMRVFDGDAQMRQMLIAGFAGTAKECFDARMRPVTPRPSNGLPAGSKV